jgi:hypothetical protein
LWCGVYQGANQLFGPAAIAQNAVKVWLGIKIFLFSVGVYYGDVAAFAKVQSVLDTRRLSY